MKCVKVRALFAKNKVRFARAEQLCFLQSAQIRDPSFPRCRQGREIREIHRAREKYRFTVGLHFTVISRP